MRPPATRQPACLVALAVAVCVAARSAPAGEPPAPQPDDRPAKFLVVYRKTPLHRGTVTVNGAQVLVFEGQEEAAGALAVPVREGANRVLVTLERLGRQKADADANSWLDIFLSPTRDAGDDDPLLDAIETDEARAQLDCRFDVADGRPGRANRIERHWADPDGKHLVYEFAGEGPARAEHHDTATRKAWTETGAARYEVHFRGPRVVTGKYYKPDGSLGAEIVEGSGTSRGWHDNGALAEETPYKDGAAEGTGRTWYASGALRATSPYVAGKLHGTYKELHENGNLAEETTFSNGLAQGESHTYYESGKLQAVRHFVDDKFQGPYREYHENGKLAEETTFSGGLAQGESHTYYESGKLYTVRQYLDDELGGPYKEYHENGVLAKEMTCAGGLAQGESKVYYESGALWAVRQFLDDKLHGPYKEYHENGNLAKEMTCAGGLAQGESRTYYESGKLYAVRHFVDDKLHGPYKQYHENGHLAEEVTFVDGLAQGESTLYHESGEFRAVRHFVDGKRHGAYKDCYENGQVHHDGMFALDKAEGPWRIYAPSGVLLFVQEYADGQLIIAPAQRVAVQPLGLSFRLPEGFDDYPGGRLAPDAVRSFVSFDRETKEPTAFVLVCRFAAIPPPDARVLQAVRSSLSNALKSDGLRSSVEAALGIPAAVKGRGHRARLTRWRDLDLITVEYEMTVNGRPLFARAVFVPLKDRTAMLIVAGDPSRKDETSRLTETVLASVEGNVGYAGPAPAQTVPAGRVARSVARLWVPVALPLTLVFLLGG